MTLTSLSVCCIESLPTTRVYVWSLAYCYTLLRTVIIQCACVCYLRDVYRFICFIVAMYVHHLGLYCVLLRRVLIYKIDVALQLAKLWLKKLPLLPFTDGRPIGKRHIKCDKPAESLVFDLQNSKSLSRPQFECSENHCMRIYWRDCSTVCSSD